MEVTDMAMVMAIMVIPTEILTMVMAGIIIDQIMVTVIGGEIKGEESGKPTCIHKLE